MLGAKEEVALQTELGADDSRGATVVRLRTATRDHVLASVVQRLAQDELQLPDLRRGLQ